ncbi:MAG: hypothetical protein ACNS62_11605 [Candidatus Cyclobacteriaceae bacterium M3_2C_046]
MKLPGIIKFVLISGVIYKLVTFKPVRKFLIAYAVSFGADWIRKELTSK